MGELFCLNDGLPIISEDIKFEDLGNGSALVGRLHRQGGYHNFGLIWGSFEQKPQTLLVRVARLIEGVRDSIERVRG